MATVVASVQVCFLQSLCEDEGPHGVFAVRCCGAKLSLVTDITVHATFDHGEKHSLDGTIEFVVLHAQVCGADIRQNSLPYKGSEGRGGGAGQQGKEGLEQTDEKPHSMDEITCLFLRRGSARTSCVADWRCKKIDQMRRKVCGFFWIADGDLRDERDEFSKVVSVVV